MKKAKGLPYIDTTASEITDFIANNFVDKDGHPTSESTVRTMLSPMDGDISIEGMDVTCPGTAYQIGAAFSIVFDILTRI